MKRKFKFTIRTALALAEALCTIGFLGLVITSLTAIFFDFMPLHIAEAGINIFAWTIRAGLFFVVCIAWLTIRSIVLGKVSISITDKHIEISGKEIDTDKN